MLIPWNEIRAGNLLNERILIVSRPSSLGYTGLCNIERAVIAWIRHTNAIKRVHLRLEIHLLQHVLAPNNIEDFSPLHMLIFLGIIF